MMIQPMTSVLCVADDDLAARVAQVLHARPLPGLRQIAVELLGKTVVLRGLVRNLYERQVALLCCRQVQGVERVLDLLEVETDRD